MSRWTTTPPTESGWYWWRLEPGFPEEIACIWQQHGTCYELLPTGELCELCSGEWQGPLTPED